jgi:hypothetical protein
MDYKFIAGSKNNIELFNYKKDQSMSMHNNISDMESTSNEKHLYEK